jgi:hypothetical protein
VRSDVRLTRGLRPLAFAIELDDGVLPLGIAARPRGDSLLELRVTSAGSAAPAQVVPTAGRAYPPTALPLVAAFRGELRVGTSQRATLFDPSSMSTRPVELAVVAESLFVVGHRPAASDTVRAWLVRVRSDDAALEFWTDAGGRVVEATYPGGYVLRRRGRSDRANVER